MAQEKKKSKTSGLKRTLLEWLGIAAVFGILYLTGLHTEVLGTMQRALLWTGLFNADHPTVETSDGPHLSAVDYGFMMRDEDGQRVALQDFKGKVLFINMWASWCPPCVAEMPTIEELYQTVSSDDDIQFLMISLDQEPQKGAQFMKNKNLPMPYYFPASSIPDKFSSPYIPTTYVVSKEGKIIYKNEGIADYSSDSFKQWMIDLAN